MDGRCINISSATSALPYLRVKGRATDFVPQPEGVKPCARRRLRKGGDLYADAFGLRIDVGFAQANPERAHSVELGKPLEDGMGEGFLKIVAALPRDPLNLGPKHVVIPRVAGIVVLRRGHVLQP